MLSAAQLIAAAEAASSLVTAATSAVSAVQTSLAAARDDMSVTDVAEVEAKLADAHAKSMALSQTLDAKLADAAGTD